jgi:hypothetical protein
LITPTATVRRRRVGFAPIVTLYTLLREPNEVLQTYKCRAWLLEQRRNNIGPSRPRDVTRNDQNADIAGTGGAS